MENANAAPRSASPLSNTKTLVTLGMLTCLAYVVTWVCKLIPPVIGFLDFDFKAIVICIGGFTFGPVAAAAMSIVEPVVEMFTYSHTQFIGCIMNILPTATFCCTASYFYKKHHTMKGAVLGLALGTVFSTVVMLLWNYLITPLYMVDVTREQVAAMLTTVFLPFNLVKWGLNMAATLLLYKPVVTALRKANLVPPSTSQQKGRVSVGFLLFAVALLATFVLWALVLLKII